MDSTTITIIAVIALVICVFAIGLGIGLLIRKTIHEESLNVLYRMATEDRAEIKKEMQEAGEGDIDVDSWNEAHIAGTK